MKSYETDLHAMCDAHHEQQAALRQQQDAEVADRRRAHAEQWEDLELRHQRDWFELRRKHKKPIGPAGLKFLAGAVGGTSNAHSG
jgi:hypothetical protein